jgi:hypothetical protein
MREFRDTYVCNQCQSLRRDFHVLQEKESKLREKLRSLEKSFQDVQLKNQLLEEENRLLRSRKSGEPILAPASDSSRLSHLLDGFDSLFQSQGEEISQLISDRDRLSNLSFSSLDLISKQDSIIQKFRSAIARLLSFISEGEDSSSSIIKEFASLGIDITREIQQMQSRISIARICSGSSGEPVQDDEILRLVNELPRAAHNPIILERITRYITQQISQKENLHKSLQSRNSRIRKLRNERRQLASLFAIKRSSQLIETITEKYAEFSDTIDTLQGRTSILEEVMNVIVQFSNRFSSDVNVKCCVSRILRWLEAPDAVDVTQEVNFLLGLLITTERGCCDCGDSGLDQSFIMNVILMHEILENWWRTRKYGASRAFGANVAS